MTDRTQLEASFVQNDAHFTMKLVRRMLPPVCRFVSRHTITGRCAYVLSLRCTSLLTSRAEKSFTSSSKRYLHNGAPTDLAPSENELLYESPLGKVITKLRTVSLVTGVIGSVGLPVIVALKGADLPSSGLLAVGMTFVAGTLGSTAAIHFVFSPYVYTIERIPVRLCLYKKKVQAEVEELVGAEPQKSKPPESNYFLYKAVSRSLFLTRIETVFDVGDVAPYKGLRPLCNFTAKGRPLYVHADYVFNEDLRKTLGINDSVYQPTKDNPDDFL